MTRVPAEDQHGLTGNLRKIGLYPAEWAAIDKLAGVAPARQWVRDAALEAAAAHLGEPLAQVRRPAPARRKPARNPDQPPAPADRLERRSIPFSRREWETISSLAAGTPGGASGWVREAAREKLSKEGT